MASDTVTDPKPHKAKPNRPGSTSAPDSASVVSERGLIWRFLHHFVRKIALFVILVTLGGWAVLAVFGQRWNLPDWARVQIETRIERVLGDMQIEFGNVSVVIDHGWRPRVRLRNVVLRDGDGQLVAQLAEAEAALAMRPLLRGQLQPKQIVLGGALASLRRDRDGNVSLSIGGATAPVEQAAGLPQLIEQWDQLFLKPQLAALVSVEIQAISLQYEDALKGRAWTLDGGTIRLERDRDQLDLSAGFSLLSGRDYVSSIEMSYASRIGDASARFSLLVEDIAAQDIAAQNVALAWLDVLRAPISGAFRGGINADGSLAPLSATLQIGAGVLQPTDQTSPVPFSGARSYFTFNPNTGLLSFDQLSVSSDWGSFTGSGQAWLGAAETQSASRVADLTGQITLGAISLNPKGVFPEPLVLDGAAADFRLELDPFRLTLGQMHIVDQQSNLLVRGELAAAPKGWTLALDAQIDQLQTERLVELWPAPVVKKPRIWVAKNLRGGMAHDMNLSLRALAGEKPVISVGFGFRDTTIQFLPSMPPITGATGIATLSNDRFVVTALQGEVVAGQGGAIDISGTSFIIPDSTIKKAAPGIVRFEGRGPVTAVLSLLNRKPLQVLKGTPVPVDVAEGMAQVTGTLSLPLKDRVQIDEMAYHYQGTVRDITSDKLVPGFFVQAAQLQIEGDQDHVKLSGPGHIAGVPVSATWEARIGAKANRTSQLSGDIELSERMAEAFNLGLPDGSVFGLGTGRFTIDLARGAAPVMSLRSDLAGVGLRLAPVGWRKSERSTGTLEVDGVFGDTVSVDHLLIEAAGLTAKGRISNRVGGGLEVASFSSVRIGRWLNAPVDIVGRGAAAPAIHIRGGRFDLRHTDFGASSGGSTQTGPLEVSLNRLQITDTMALHGFKGTFSADGGFSGNYTGSLNGQTPVYGTLTPKGDRSTVLVQANDAGAVFRAAGMLTMAQGGSFRLKLVPVDSGPGQYDGALDVSDTRVRDAPAIAAILNAVSIVGLIDELSGKGIHFLKIEANFRLGPKKLVLYQSSAEGPSMGLSMDGYYDVPSGVLDMQGVISPIYLINAIGSVLTRKGEGLIGFSYKLRGTSDQPDVAVNPLSGLAPGMLREVFRKTRPKPEGGRSAFRREIEEGRGVNAIPYDGR
ncbi:MAG: DUF3971 domain-containing protein [Rhodobacteraceae bacterium]|nr:DUF3971 domain-containing protein [Paracoccaceae bacterium]